MKLGVCLAYKPLSLPVFIVEYELQFSLYDASLPAVLLIDELNLRLQVVLVYPGLLNLQLYLGDHDLQSVDSVPRLIPLRNQRLLDLIGDSRSLFNELV